MSPERPPPFDLDRIQGWLSAVIRHPGGTLAALGTQEARSYVDSSPERLEEVVLTSPALAAAERIDIYHRAYHSRLLECLKAEYPGLLHALGDALFAGFASSYLRCYPPRSYSLAGAGKHFSRWLQETRPDGDRPPEGREHWPDFLVDLAVLERTRVDIANGPGLEDTGAPDADRLLCIPIEDWPRLTFQKAPCLRLLSLRAAVHRYLDAVRTEHLPAFPPPSLAWLAVTRRNYEVQIHELVPDQVDLLSGLVAGLPVAAAVERASGLGGAGVDEWMPRIRTWLCLWTDLGFFQAIGGLMTQSTQWNT